MNKNPKETSIEMEPPTLELTPVGSRTKAEQITATSATGIDTTDEGCQGCTTAKTSTLTRNDSIVSSSSQDNDISLNIKKTNFVHKGMMDIALLTANANQLRFLLTYNTEEKTFYVSVTLLVLSLIVQVAVGLGLVYKRYMKRVGHRSKADKVSGILICGIFFLVVINVLVASFTTTNVISP